MFVFLAAGFHTQNISCQISTSNMQCVLSVEPRQLYTIVAQITQPQKMSGSQAILGKKHSYSLKSVRSKKFHGIRHSQACCLSYYAQCLQLCIGFFDYMSQTTIQIYQKNFGIPSVNIAERSQQLSVQHIISNRSYVFSSWPSFSLHNLCNKRLPDPMPLTFDHLRQSWLSIVLSH